MWKISRPQLQQHQYATTTTNNVGQLVCFSMRQKGEAYLHYKINFEKQFLKNLVSFL